MEAGDIEVIDLWEEGDRDGNQPVHLYKRASEDVHDTTVGE